jgi:broad specificity phosphatase PhoE
MELYLIRHGDMQGDPHQCWDKAPVQNCLSDLGVRQAQALGEALKDVAFTDVYASSLGRAIETAQAITRKDQPIRIIPWLIEWRPATVTRGCDDANYESMLAAATKLRPEMSWKTDAGESTFDIAGRVIPGFLDLMRDHGVHAGHGGYLLDDPKDDQRLALVGHGGSLGVLAAFLLGLPLRPYAPIHFAQTGVGMFQFVQRVDVWYPALSIPTPYPAIK